MMEYSNIQEQLADAEEDSEVKDIDQFSLESTLKCDRLQPESRNDAHNSEDNDNDGGSTISSVLMSPGLESNLFWSDLLVAELQEASDMFEENEGRMQVKLMVGEAVTKGLLNALEINAREALNAKETKLQKLNELLQEKFRMEKDSAVELVRREASLREICLTDFLVEKDDLLQYQLQRIELLESSEQELRDQLYAQNEKVVQLMQSKSGNSELSTKLTAGKYSLSDESVAREGRMKSLQDDIELLSFRIEEQEAEKSTLSEELSILRMQITAKDRQILQQRGALQDASMHNQTSSLLEEHLRQEIGRLTSNLQEHVEASTHTLKGELEDQKWKHEFQTSIIMETVRGMEANLSKELSLLGADLTDKDETFKFESRLLKQRHSELVSLRASKSSWEMKLAECNGVIEACEQNMREKDKVLEDKLQRLRQAEEAILNLQEKVTHNELLIQKYKDEMPQKESVTKQQGAVQKNDVMLLEAQDKVGCLEQEVGVKEVQLKTVKDEMEEMSWRKEIEEQLLMICVESSLQESSKQILDLKKALSSKDHEMSAFMDEMELRSASQRDALLQKQSNLRVAQKEIEDLKDEIQRGKLLEEALAEQDLKHRLQLDVVSTLLGDSGVENAAAWNEERSVLVTEVSQLVQERGVKKPSDKVETSEQMSHPLDSIPQRGEQMTERDERINDELIRLPDVPDGERKHVSSRASMLENLAALEEERNRLHLMHSREKEKLVACYKTMLDEKNILLSSTIKIAEEKSQQIVELEGVSMHATDEINDLRGEMSAIRQKLENDFAGQIQALLATSQELGSDVAHKTDEYNLRLEAAEGLVKYLLQQFSALSLSETENLQNVHNLQKAETEVDVLGDEVDALLEVLEKVYTMLNHYSPIIQHYPGLADLVKIVRQEVIKRT